MSDLERQIRAYASALDEAAPPLEDLAGPRSATRRQRRRAPAWAVAVAAAAIAVVVGSVAVLSSLRDPADDTASTSLPASTTTTPGPSTTIQPTIAPSEYLTLVSETPTWSGGENGDVGGLPRVAAGPVALVDGTYHVVFSAGGEDDMWDAVFWATSPDGSTWAVDPVPVEFPAVQGAADLLIGSLERLDDGMWAIYYHVAFDTGGHGNHVYEYSFGRATAASLAGPWTADERPVLAPGPEGSWDAGAIRYPNVVRQGDSWLMYYTGYPARDGSEVGRGAMGLATSRDGIVWEKRSEPVFSGDPALAWEDGAISRIDVAWTGSRYLLLYSGRTGGSRGLAISPDGIGWDRVEDDPVLTGFDVPRPAIFSTSILVDGDRTRVYVANGGYRTTSAVYEMELGGL